MNLIVDGNNLAYRECFSKGSLSYNGKPTGAILGVLQQILKLTKIYPGEVFFCWDSRKSLRKDFYPNYKANRGSREDIPEALQAVFSQIEELRESILPHCGYPNQFLQEGYEADDLVAALCRRPGFHVIVSSDNDLFQCLGPSVKLYNLGKKKEVTYKSFQEENGITPQQWIEVKAMAGDMGDNIPGIPGVGFITAIKHLLGKGTEKLAKKVEIHAELIYRNRVLIKLPWPGAEFGEILQSKFNFDGFRKVCEDNGLDSLLKRM